METVAQDAENNNQENADTDRQQALARALGQPLTQLLDRRAALYQELNAVDADIYQELVNTLQGQIGTMVMLFEAKLRQR